MLDIPICPTCGSKRIRKVRRTWKGKRYAVPDLEFYECPACGEKLYGPEAMRQIEAYSPAYPGCRRGALPA